MPKWPWQKAAPKAVPTEVPAMSRNIAIIASTSDGEVKGVMRITTRDQELYDRPELSEAAQKAAQKVLGSSTVAEASVAAARGQIDLYQSIQSTLKPLYAKEVPSFQVVELKIVG